MNITEFTNAQIVSEDLPAAEEIRFEKLEPKMIKADIISSLIFFGILSALVFILGLIPIDWVAKHQWIIIIFMSSVFLLSILINIISYKYKSYAIRSHDVSYCSGIIFRTTIAIPFNRVQHCEISQGPLERIFNLVTLKVFTAGGSNSDLQIPGLYKDHAEVIKGFILRKSGIDEEE